MEQTSHQFIKFVRKQLAQYGMKLIIGRGKCVNVVRHAGYVALDLGAEPPSLAVVREIVAQKKNCKPAKLARNDSKRAR